MPDCRQADQINMVKMVGLAHCQYLSGNGTAGNDPYALEERGS